MSLTQFQDDDRTFQLMQNSWATRLNPLLANPMNACVILKNISLLSASNPNVVNHKLGKGLQGWFIVGQNAQANLWDSQASNQTPQLTLNLNTSADVIVTLAVF